MENAQFLVQLTSAIGLFLTAVGSVIAAISSIRNGRIVTEVKQQVGVISLDVDGRFSASQAQLSRLIDHVAAINPGLVLDAAKAAAEVLKTAHATREMLQAQAAISTPVSVVPPVTTEGPKP